MAITQLSVFLDNTAGRLAEVTRILGNASVNIRGFSVADTADFGILRIIVDEPIRALEVLHRSKFTVHQGAVILASVPDRPGGLTSALEGFADKGINVEYAYAAAHSLIVFGLDDIPAAEAIFANEGIRLITTDELREM